MKKYKIAIFYKTGGSFGSEDCNQDLSVQWDNLDIAKDNIQRIKEHYIYLCKRDNWRISKADKENLVKAEKEQRWFRAGELDKESEFSLVLKADGGEDYVQSVFWFGYFEALYEANIVHTDVENNDMRISFDKY